MATERISKLEGAYEQVDKRLDDLNQSMTSLRADVNSRLADMNSRLGDVNSRVDSLEAQLIAFRDETNSRFNHVYILIGGSWVTIMAALLAIFLSGN